MDRISFTINGIVYSVGSEVSSDVTVLDYVRNVLELRGTKYMCRQAGCGACIVAVKKPGATVLQAINSCMVSITSCQDWEIQTIEELGNRKKGYHVIQKTLANHNGSQCGHCSPGWVMSMYCLLHENKDLTMADIEESFGSNICRCTGYRPILEAFKTFAKNSPKHNIPDMEELTICNKSGKSCKKTCHDNETSKFNCREMLANDDEKLCINKPGTETCKLDNVEFITTSDDDDDGWSVITKCDATDNQIKSVALKDGRKWFQVKSVINILQILQREGNDSYMLVAGNTAKGAYPILEYPRVLIDINGIVELKKVILDQNLIIGSGVTLSELLNVYKDNSQKNDFGYLKEFYNHLEKVAHKAVRNLGTIGGNLMIKHKHNEFQSDLYLMFQTADAELTILNRQSKQDIVTMEQFLKTDMVGAIILNVRLPPLAGDVIIKTYKVMPRYQNAHAIVNFGAYYQFSRGYDKLVQCRLVYGGLTSGYTRASATEIYLVGRELFKNETLQGAVTILKNELVVTNIPPEPSIVYRKRLAIGLFYKSMLCMLNILKPLFKSGATKLHDSRPVSTAKRSYETKPDLWPLTQPIPKVEALIQCAGEAFYTEDMPSYPYEVFGDLVLSKVSRGTIVSIDTRNVLVRKLIKLY